MIGDVRVFQCFPVDGWLLALAAGWQFDLIAEPMNSHHGFWSVMLEWKGDPDAV